MLKKPGQWKVMEKQSGGLMTRRTGILYDVEHVIFSITLFIHLWNIGVEEGNEFG